MKTKQTILVVDDDPSILLGVKAKIKRHGYRVITAKDGNEGIEQIKEHKPDLVLSDVMMPFLDGFEMRKIIRQYAAFASIPFIFLTARTEREDRFEQARGRKEMKAQAEKEMEELKHEILQNFHHELRTPLTNILLPLELATSEKLDDPEEKLRFIRMALSNASRLESLTTDLILLSNIDQGNLNSIRQSLDINIHLLNPIRKRLERYGEKELEFISEILSPDEIFAPRQEFTHSILHLLDNAFKFSPKNGKVKLIIKVLEKGIGISVQDDGPGIPPELSEKVFERFYQISQGDTRANEGLGVGLTIARAVFEANGGYLKIIDNKHGCCVQAVYPN